MSHSSTERLIDYWRVRKAGRLSPLRSSVDPSDLTEVLAQLFILGRAGPGQHLFRLAGGLITDLHQRDLRGADFLSLWAPSDRPRLSAAIEGSRRSCEPVIMAAEARADDGRTARVEIMTAPLRSETAPVDRVIGLYQPLSPLAELRGRPVIELGLIRFTSESGADASPRLRLAAVDGRLIA